ARPDSNAPVIPAAKPETPPVTAESDPDAEPSGGMAGAPTLILLPMTVAPGTRAEGPDFDKAEKGLRLGFGQSGRFRVWTEERSIRGLPEGWGMPEDCFSKKCVESAARRLKGNLAVASQFTMRDSIWVMKLILAEIPGGRIREAARIWAKPDSGGIIPFAREAALLMADPDYRHRDSALAKSRIVGMDFSTGPWREIPWINPRDTVNNRNRWGWSGAGLLLAGTGLAWAQGQLSQEDGNSAIPTRKVLSGAGPQSFLRGFFAAPTLGARYAAMGGAGIAHVGNGLALMMNPAGVAEADRENVIAAKRTLPDGTPSFFMAYSSPLYHKWSQGVGVQFEGDRLANETTLQGALAYDLGGLGKEWSGIRAGAETKIYLAQVGESGTGEDRSTGRSFGMGLDLGLQARLTDRITAALAIRDVAGFLRHTNTLTDRSYSEILPTEYRLGAAYRASRDLLLLMDGQKGLWADQVDHIRLGGERTLWEFLALRCGLHEIFGREAVRKLSVGFGLDTDGMTDKNLKMKVALNYGYEFGLNEDEPLGGGQQFSLEASF
ncbi:MAG: hypothetical protein JWP91_4398, partial [Fibrobacteres bacterium]|nr:hypothetical protein [Fibrobacterota bacterium]